MPSLLDGSTLRSRRLLGLAGLILIAILAFLIYSFWRGSIREWFSISLTSKQFLYALVSVELPLALYFYGVGWISPHWRPDPKPPAKPQAAQHPLGPADQSKLAVPPGVQAAKSGRAPATSTAPSGEASQ
jgi:hypothetical protein